MTESGARVMSMAQIIVIMIGIALVLGLVFGGLGGMLGISPGILGAGIGAAVGLIGVILLNKRKAALAAQNRER